MAPRPRVGRDCVPFYVQERERDAAFAAAEKRKLVKYRRWAQEQSAEFYTLVFNDFGAWSRQVKEFLTKMRDSVRIPEAGRLFARMRQEISCAIIRNNGRAILAHCGAEGERQVEKKKKEEAAARRAARRRAAEAVAAAGDGGR